MKDWIFLEGGTERTTDVGIEQKGVIERKEKKRIHARYVVWKTHLQKLPI
jgi:hypothetical protein